MRTGDRLKSKSAMRVINILLDSLPVKERSRITKLCEMVEHDFGDVLHEQGKAIRYAYFPVSGFISLVTIIDDRHPLEMELIGNEGVVGGTLALGVMTSPMRAIVQGSGQILRMKASDLVAALDTNPNFKKRLHSYIFVLMQQLSQIAACTHFHKIEPRLARWLLMTHDRSHADHFRLTHEFLAGMLGVRRSGVTIAAGVLQSRKLIDYNRGEIKILNRKGLEAMSCKCYRTLINDYDRQFS
jgi:CRP-like cAMP-binding protein